MTRTARLLCSVIAAPAIVVAVTSAAHGHARLKSPAPRDNHSDYKSPPVGGVGIGEPCGVARTATQPSTALTPGAAITVTWEETVNHPGCFVIDFSPGNDANFVKLGAKSHANPPAPTNPSTASPRQWSLGVTLPTAPCTACTMRVRQLMLTSDLADTACPPATIPAASTYYSCANVVLGTTGAGGAGGGGAGGATGTGGSAAGGRGGSTATGRGGSTATGRGGSGSGGTGAAGQAGTSGQAGSGASGQAGDNGQAGTSGQAGDNGQAGTSGQAGDNGQAGTSGQAGDSGQAGNGSSGTAGSSPTGQAGTGGGGGEASGGCRIGGGAAPAPLALLLAIVLLRRSRRRSRS